MAQAQRSKINTRDLVKLESFIKVKDTVSLTNQHRNRMETFFSSTSGRGVIFKIYKELKKVDIIIIPQTIQLKWGTG